ncbi:hypothetical protein HII36_32595 [Nonomuraea sp. NN258]|uniref:hypothetical protein n=1 Tax=Nonomuraea antri TaxID=2730852 RepID=UPI0015685E57|nr:hypothetical protein [Nonomuraea antri]NRQ36537.1 hypothetical protein [Nonomuraea antri]
MLHLISIVLMVNGSGRAVADEIRASAPQDLRPWLRTKPESSAAYAQVDRPSRRDDDIAAGNPDASGKLSAPSAGRFRGIHKGKN